MLPFPPFGARQKQRWALWPTGLSLDWGRTPPARPGSARGGSPVYLHRNRKKFIFKWQQQAICIFKHNMNPHRYTNFRLRLSSLYHFFHPFFFKGSIFFILYENNLANSWAERRENIFKYLRNGRNCCSINNKVSLRDRKNSKYFKLNWCLCVYVPAFPKAQRCITWAGTEQRTWPCILLDISCLLSVQSPAVK